MIERLEYQNVTWFNVMLPTTEDVRTLVEEADVPADFINDLTSMTPRTETLTTKNAIKVTLDFPIVKRTDIKHPHEVKFIATKNSLVTVRFEDITAIHSFAKKLEMAEILQQKDQKPTGVHLLLALLSHLYTALDEKIDYLESRIQSTEETIFQDNEKEMLYAISDISRRLVSFRHTILAHKRALNELDEAVTAVFPKKLHNGVRTLVASYDHLVRRVGGLRNTLDDLRDTNNALLSTKQNEVMKILTIMAFITFPLTLFTSMFGMNTVTTPIVGYKHDFWIILGIMLIVSIGFFAYFKYKKWM